MNNLVRAIKAAKHFAAKNDIRYYLNGIALYFEDGEVVTIAASDGHTCFITGDKSLNTQPMLLNALELSGDTTIAVTDDLTIVVGGLSIATIDGRYPDLKRVIPDHRRK